MNKIKKFLASYSITTHSLVVAFTTLVTLYATVPQFAALVNGIYAKTPSWFHTLFTAAFGIWSLYQGSKKTGLSVVQGGKPQGQ